MELKKNKSLGKLIGGCVMIAIALLGFLLFSKMNDYNLERNRLLGPEALNKYTMIAKSTFALLAITMVIGVVLILVAINQRYKNKIIENKVSVNPVLLASYGLFCTYDGKYSLNIKADNTCVISQDGKISYGTLQYDGGDSIRIHIQDFGTAFVITPKNGNLHVKGGHIDDTFYRKG